MKSLLPCRLVQVFRQTRLDGERINTIMDAGRAMAGKLDRPAHDQAAFKDIILELLTNINHAYGNYGLADAPSLTLVSASPEYLRAITGNYAREADIQRCFDGVAHLKTIPHENAFDLRNKIHLGENIDRMPYSDIAKRGASVGLLTIHCLNGRIAFRRGIKPWCGEFYPLYTRVTLA